MQLSKSGFITFEYMHSFENAGKVALYLTQSTVTSANAVHCDGIRSPQLSSCYSSSLNCSYEVDSYVPEERHALITSVQLYPSSAFVAGQNAELHVKLIKLSNAERSTIGGEGKFKITSVASC